MITYKFFKIIVSAVKRLLTRGVRTRGSRDSLSLLPAGTALRGLATAVGGGHHGLDRLIQQHPAGEEKERKGQEKGEGQTPLSLEKQISENPP